MSIIGTSATAIDLKLEQYEVDALIDWHRSQEEHHSNRREYRDADHHQRRAEQLTEFVKPKP